MEPAAPIRWTEAYPPPGSFEAVSADLAKALAILEPERRKNGLPPLSGGEHDWLIHGLAFGRAAKRTRPPPPHKAAELWNALAKTYDELQDQLASLDVGDRSIRRWLEDERGKSRGKGLFARRMADEPPAPAGRPKRLFKDELALAAAFAFHYVTGKKPGRANRTAPAPLGSRVGSVQQPAGLFLNFLKLVCAARGLTGSVDNLARDAIKAMVEIRPEIGRQSP